MRLFNLHTHRISTDISKEYQVIDILNVYPEDYSTLDKEQTNVFYSCGIHPWYADKSIINESELEQIMQDEKVVAIGEVGLDKLCEVDFELQKKVFRFQIKIAIRLGKPLIIHCVKAWDELIALYKEYKPTNKWIIHGFRGGAEQAQQLEKIGFYFSIGEKFDKEAVNAVSRDKLFIETDDSIEKIDIAYKKIAKARGESLKSLAKMTECNIQKSFHKSILLFL